METAKSTTSSSSFASSSSESPGGAAADHRQGRSLDFGRAKWREWRRQAAYPLVAKATALLAEPAFCLAAWPPTRNFYSFAAETAGCPLLRHFARSFRLLGWTAVDVDEADKLALTGDNILVAGANFWTALKRRAGLCRFACCLTYWEQQLPCLESYWQLCEALEAHERCLQQFSQMGLLGGETPRRLRPADFLIPTVHLGEVWGGRLARFLKAHDSFRLRRASASGSSGDSQLTRAVELRYRPTGEDTSGRKRLNQLEGCLKAGAVQFASPRMASEFSWPGLVLQAAASPRLQAATALGRRFRLEVFLLLAPRRNPAAFGFAGFCHRGLVRIDASDSPEHRLDWPSQQQQQQQQQQSQKAPITLHHHRQPTFAWLPEQLADYLDAVEPQDRWLMTVAYPQIQAVCAYLCTALGQHLLDSSHGRFQLLRLSFLPDGDTTPGRRRRLRLDDFSQRPLWSDRQSAGAGAAASPGQYCESLVMPRMLEEAALIVAELLVRSGQVGNLPARKLVAPHNMKLVFDTVDPEVQRSLLLLRD